MNEITRITSPSDLHTEIHSPYESPPRADQIAERQAVITAELQRMDADPVAGEDTHGELRGQLVAELDALRTERQLLAQAEHAAVRAEKIEGIKRAAQNPANLERPIGSSAPALVKDARRDRLESPEEVIQRAGNPWRQETGPLDRETGAGLAARAHAAVEALEGRLSHDGSEKLASLLSLRPSPFETTYELRTVDDIKRSAELVLALSNPYYESAFRSVLRYPEAFAGGTGLLMWSDEERLAFKDVMACRSTLLEDSGTGGQYLLPLVLDSSIMLTNAGSANPWRRICRTVSTTAKAWNGVTSAGTTANWVAEGVISTDTSPSLGALVLTPLKETVWMTASFEEVADTSIASQVPVLLQDGFDRLEEAAFSVGTGTAQPKGAVLAATVGSNTGLVNVANGPAVYTLLSDLPARFRVGAQAKPYWVANIAIINLLRQVAPFTAATESIVNDDTNPPTMFGYPLLESTSMDASNATGGHKNLLFFDANSFLICERVGTTVVFEPLVPGAGGIIPAGISGWYAYRRVTSDIVTATAARVHNNA